MARTPPLPDYKAYSIHHPAALKPLRQGAVYVLVRGLLLLTGGLGLRGVQRLGRGIGWLVYRLSARQRRLSHLQLAMALPELPLRERRRIALQSMEHQGMTVMETMALPRLRAQSASWVRLEGADRLQAAYAQGRGVVLVTAHIANWELLTVALERLRIHATVVVSRLNNARLNEMLGSIRRFEYLEVAERGSETSPRQLLTCLRRGDALVLAIDADIEAQGVFVDFFGIPANTPRAPASLALKLGAPLLTFFGTRQADGTHVLEFTEVPVTEDIRTADDPMRALTQAVSARTEAHIRAHPEQWMWNHRRWKRRPDSEGASEPSRDRA